MSHLWEWWEKYYVHLQEQWEKALCPFFTRHICRIMEIMETSHLQSHGKMSCHVMFIFLHVTFAESWENETTKRQICDQLPREKWKVIFELIDQVWRVCICVCVCITICICIFKRGGEILYFGGGRKKYFVISLRFWMFDRDSIKSLMRLLTGWWKDVFWDELNVMWFCGTIEWKYLKFFGLWMGRLWKWLFWSQIWAKSWPELFVILEIVNTMDTPIVHWMASSFGFSKGNRMNVYYYAQGSILG